VKIVQITPFFYPAWAYGGIARVVYDLSRHLRMLGHDVTVVTTDVYDATSRVVVDSSPVLIEGVKTYYLQNISNDLAYRKDFYWPAILDMKALEDIAAADVIHMHKHRHVLNHVAHHIAVKQGIPYVFSGHGTIPKIYDDTVIKKLYRILAGRRLLDGASVYHAVSNVEMKQYVAAGLDESKIKVIYNGIDPDGFKNLPPRGEFRNMMGIPHDRGVVLFLGKTAPRKGVDFLVKAISLLKRKDVVLVIAGGIRKDDVKVLKKLSAKLDIQDRVLFTGILSESNRLSAYKDADVTVYPSTREVFGLVPFESIMCGTPTIVGDDSGACEIISRAGAGDPVEYGNAIELAGAIDRMLNDRHRAKNLVDRGRRFIETELSWETLTPKYLEVYESVVAAKKEEKRGE